MQKFCHKCASILPEAIGEQILCSYCGQNHTIYPTGSIVSSFDNILHYDPNLSTRGFWILKRNVFSIDEFSD